MIRFKRVPSIRHLLFAAAVMAVAGLPRADAAFAGEAFIPPIVEATVTGVASEPLGDGRWLVTIEASIANTSGEPLDEVEIALVDTGVLAAERSYEGLFLGTLAVEETRALVWEVEAYGPYEPESGLMPLFAGSAAGEFGERRAVWVETEGEAGQ